MPSSFTGPSYSWKHWVLSPSNVQPHCCKRAGAEYLRYIAWGKLSGFLTNPLIYDPEPKSCRILEKDQFLLLTSLIPRLGIANNRSNHLFFITLWFYHGAKRTSLTLRLHKILGRGCLDVKLSSGKASSLRVILGGLDFLKWRVAISSWKDPPPTPDFLQT